LHSFVFWERIGERDKRKRKRRRRKRRKRRKRRRKKKVSWKETPSKKRV